MSLGKGFGTPGSGVDDGRSEGLVGWPRHPGGGLEEKPAFIGGEVHASAGIDKLEIAGQARHFASRTDPQGLRARLRPWSPEFGIPAISPRGRIAADRKRAFALHWPVNPGEFMMAHPCTGTRAGEACNDGGSF